MASLSPKVHRQPRARRWSPTPVACGCSRGLQTPTVAARECEWDLEGCASAHEARFWGEKDTGREATGPAQSMTMSDTDLGQESRDVVWGVEPTD